MNRSLSTIRYCLGLCLAGPLALFANPNPPTVFPVLSEIQLIDTLHWNVEVNASVGGMSGFVRYPCTIDSFKLFCRQDSTTPPVDSMRRPVKGEVFDSKGIAVLTPAHFPGLKLRKGATVFLQFTSYGSYQYLWRAKIPLSITPAQSLSGSDERYCCGYYGGVCEMYCPRLRYTISNNPTIGAPNPYTSLVPRNLNTAAVGHVRLIPTEERTKIVVAVSGQTGNTGEIDLFSADGAAVRSFRFTCHGPGTYTVRWDGNNENGHSVPAGTYACRVRIGKDVSCKGLISW